LDGKPEGKKPLGRPRRGCEYNIRMNVRKIRWEGVDCIRLAQDRDQWQSVVFGNEPPVSIKAGNFVE
jgi:cephalosporin hydroxylase